MMPRASRFKVAIEVEVAHNIEDWEALDQIRRLLGSDDALSILDIWIKKVSTQNEIEELKK